jgi:hypothetical protein
MTTRKNDTPFQETSAASATARACNPRRTAARSMAGVRIERATLDAEGLECRRRRRRPGSQGDHRRRHESLHCVRDRCDHRVDYIRMREQQVLHFLGVDVLSAAAEHIVDAAAEVTEAVAIAQEHVAGAQPPVDELLGGNFRLVVIAEADIGAANHELAELGLFVAGGIDELHLDAGRRDADTTSRHRPPVDRSTEGAAAFGEAVAFRCLHARRPPRDRCRTRRCGLPPERRRRFGHGIHPISKH